MALSVEKVQYAFADCLTWDENDCFGMCKDLVKPEKAGNRYDT